MPNFHAPKNLVNQRTPGGGAYNYSSGRSSPSSGFKAKNFASQGRTRSPRLNRGSAGSGGATFKQSRFQGKSLPQYPPHTPSPNANPVNAVKSSKAVKASPLVAAKAAKSTLLTTLGIGALKVGLAALAILSIKEGFFPSHGARASVSDIDPSLRKPSNFHFYPGEAQAIGESVTASRTEQGFGDVVGVQYEFLFEYEPDLDSGDPPVVGWHSFGSAYRGPFIVNNIHFSAGTNVSANKNDFPEIYATGRGGKWFLQGTCNDQNGNLINFSSQTPGQSGIFTPSRGKYLNMRPIGGQVQPPVVQEENAVSETITFYKVPIVGSDGNLDYYLTVADDIRYNALPLDNIRPEDDIPTRSSIKPIESEKFVPPPIPTPEKVTNQKPDIVDNLTEVITSLLGGKANATELETLKEQQEETNRQLDNLNRTEGLNTSETIVETNPSTPGKQTPKEKKAKKEKITEPVEKVSYKRVGNPVTGYKTLKTVETTESNGIKTTVTYDAETGEIYGKINRTIPGGTTIKSVGIHGDPFDLTDNDPASLIEPRSPFDRSTRPKIKEFDTGKTEETKQPKIVGTPTPTGTGVKTIPEPTEVEQTEAQKQQTLEGKDIATVAALIAALPRQPIFSQAVEEAVEVATCNSAQGGCLRREIAAPITNNQNNILNALGVAGDASILNIVQDTNNVINSPTHGLRAVQDFASRAWDTLKVDKALNILNTALNIHNAAMLSSRISVTVGAVIDNSLATLGLKLKTPTGEEIGFTQAIGQSATNLIKSILGTDNYTELTQTWAKANRIYQASVNVLSNVRSIVDSAQDVAEETGENVSIIGNALKRSGVVRENSYNWMPENLATESRWLRRLEKIQNTIDIFEDITDSTRDISEELKDLKENSKIFEKEIGKIKKDKTKEEEENTEDAFDIPDIKEEDNSRFVEKED